MALKQDGTLWSWGANDKGQLGIGNYTNSTVPVQVKMSQEMDLLKILKEFLLLRVCQLHWIMMEMYLHGD